MEGRPGVISRGWRGAGGRGSPGSPAHGGTEDADAAASSVGASPREADQVPAGSLEGP